MVCSFGFVSFGCAIYMFWPVDGSPMLLEEQYRTLQLSKEKVNLETRKNRHAKNKHNRISGHRLKMPLHYCLLSSAFVVFTNCKELESVATNAATVLPHNYFSNISKSKTFVASAHRVVLSCSSTVFSRCQILFCFEYAAGLKRNR